MNTETEPITQREVPAWVGAMIAVVLLTSMIGGGGYWIWAKANQPPRSQLVEVQGIPQARIIAAPAPPAMGIQKTVSGANQVAYTVRARDCLMTISKGPNDKDWVLQARYNKPDLMTPDQTAAITARFRLTSDPAFAKSLKLTDDQRKQLLEVPASVTMVVNDADRAKLRKLVEQYIAASNSANEQALVKALADVAAASLPATRALIDERVKKIQTILTADQIAPFKN